MRFDSGRRDELQIGRKGDDERVEGGRITDEEERDVVGRVEGVWVETGHQSDKEPTILFESEHKSELVEILDKDTLNTALLPPYFLPCRLDDEEDAVVAASTAEKETAQETNRDSVCWIYQAPAEGETLPCLVCGHLEEEHPRLDFHQFEGEAEGACLSR